MASHFLSPQLITLRVITQRIAATSTWQLTHVAPYLAGMVISCEVLFRNAERQGNSQAESETILLLHKFKTQISTLLYDKTPEGRWAAILLIKATTEIGGWEVLRASGLWVRGLLAILGRGDPESIKELCIITLTRIFLLTQHHQSILREITTPSLPGFIALCLEILKADLTPAQIQKRKTSGCHSLCVTAISALCELIPHHPTLFRPFASQIRAYILPHIAATCPELGADKTQCVNSKKTTASIAEPAQKLLVLLSVCAPRNTSGDEWTRTMHDLIRIFHRTADLVFRAVSEDWKPSSTTSQPDTSNDKSFNEVVSDMKQDSFGLPGWKGIYAGMDRLDGILHTLQMFLTTPIPSAVNVPVGSILDVLTRVLSVLPPSNKERFNNGMRLNLEIGRDEREGFWTGLSRVQISALEVYLLLISRLGLSSIVFCDGVLEQALLIFESDIDNADVRKTVYELVSNVLSLIGLSLKKSSSGLLSNCARRCCEDALPSAESPSSAAYISKDSSKIPPAKGASAINADSYFKSLITPGRHSSTSKDVQISAAKLLPLTISNIPHGLFPFALRAQIDGTAILTGNKLAMMASVLNPPQGQKGARQVRSVLPFLARQFPDKLEVEAMIRPRMRVLQRENDNLGFVLLNEDLNNCHDSDGGNIYHQKETLTTGGRMKNGENLYPFEQTNQKTLNVTPDHSSLVAVVQQPQPLLRLETRLSSPSQKRNRDTSLTENNSPASANSKLEPSAVSEDSLALHRKRQRVETTDPISTNQAISPDPENLLADLQTPLPIAKEALNYCTIAKKAAFGVEENNSDDSETFVMPHIDMELDTDDESEGDE